MILPLALAALTSLSAWWAWETFELRYSPDFELYTQGGLGIYPSPIGRLLGSQGTTPFVLLSIVAAGLIVLLVWKASGTSWSSVALVASPALLYLGHSGIDPLGLVFYTAALAGYRPALTLPLAALTHLSLLPFALLEAIRSPRVKTLHKATLAFFLVPCAIFVLVVTPYGGIVAGLLDGRFLLAFLQGLGAGALIALPAVLVFRVGLAHLIGWGIGAFECGLQGHLQARYLLPAAVLLCATGRLRAWSLHLSGRCAMIRGRSLQRAPAEVLQHLDADYDQGGMNSVDRKGSVFPALPESCARMDVPASRLVHPRATLWTSLGGFLCNDASALVIAGPLACPVEVGKRQLIFEPVTYDRPNPSPEFGRPPSRARRRSHLHVVDQDGSRV